MKLPAPNRLAVYLASAGGLATAVAVPLADLDTTSVAGIIAGLAAILTVVRQWLVGWAAHERDERTLEQLKAMDTSPDKEG